MRELDRLVINQDAIALGVTVSGLWLFTARFPRLKIAAKLISIAWRVLRHGP